MSIFALDRDLPKGTKLVCRRHGDPYTVTRGYRCGDILRNGTVQVAQNANPNQLFSLPADALMTLFEIENSGDNGS